MDPLHQLVYGKEGRNTPSLTEATRSEDNQQALALLAFMTGTSKMAVMDFEFNTEHILEVGIVTIRDSPCVSLRGGVRRRDSDEPFGYHVRGPAAWLVDPVQDGELSWQVRKTGLRMQNLRGAGTFAEHLPRLVWHLRDAEVYFGWWMYGDKDHLEEEIRLAGATYPQLTWVDMAALFRKLHPEVGVNPSKVCKLEEAAAYYGLDLSAAHYAYHDVKVTTEVLLLMVEEWVDRGYTKAEFGAMTKGFLSRGGWDPKLKTTPFIKTRSRWPAGHQHDAEAREHDYARREDRRIRQYQLELQRTGWENRTRPRQMNMDSGIVPGSSS